MKTLLALFIALSGGASAGVAAVAGAGAVTTAVEAPSDAGQSDQGTTSADVLDYGTR